MRHVCHVCQSGGRWRTVRIELHAMIVAPIPVSSRLADTIAVLTPSALADLQAHGIDGVIAYLGHNLTAALVDACAAAHMGLVPVNVSRGEGWIPTAALGTADARASVAALTALGVPVAGLDDWCDVEGCGADPTAYARAWCAELVVGGDGRRPKAYVGAGALLGGHAWYALPFVGYWHSCSAQIPEPDCGFQLDQIYPPNQMCGSVQIDYNFARRDFHGRAPTWLINP